MRLTDASLSQTGGSANQVSRPSAPTRLCRRCLREYSGTVLEESQSRPAMLVRRNGKLLLAHRFVIRGKPLDQLGAGLGLSGAVEELLAHSRVDRAPVLGEMCHEHGAFLHRSDGVPDRLFGG